MGFTSRTKVRFLVLYVVLVSFQTLACDPGTYLSESLFNSCVACPKDCEREGKDVQSCKDACEKTSTTTLAVTASTSEIPKSSERVVVMTGHTVAKANTTTLEEIQFAGEASGGNPKLTTVLMKTVTIVISVIAGVLIVVVLGLLVMRWKKSRVPGAGTQPPEALTEIRVVSPEVGTASDNDTLMMELPIPESGEESPVLSPEETVKLISETLRGSEYSSNMNLPETSL